MIKRYFLIALNCLLFSNSVYGATEVKPPEGPFVSQLRATFSLLSDNVLNAKNAVIKEKKYIFQVPDLGRYQERAPATVLIQKPFTSPSVFTQENAMGMADKTFKPEFDRSAFAYSTQQNNVLQNSPYSMPVQNQRQQAAEKMSFDAMPISDNTQNDPINSYPAEWSQLSPLNRGQSGQRQDHGVANHGFNEFVMPDKFDQNAYPIGQPFSNPRLNERMNNNSTYGYK